MFKTREEIDAELERIMKEKPEVNGVREALVRVLEEGFIRTLQSTTLAAIVLGFKETIHIQSLVLLDMYLYSVEEAPKFQERENIR